MANREFVYAASALLFITILISIQSTSIIAQEDEVDVILKLSLVPSVVESGQATYSIGYVQILDTDNELPILAPRDLKIELVSDDPTIVSVPSYVVIPAKHDYAKFDVTAGNVDGETDVSALFQDQVVTRTFRVGETIGELPDDVELVINLPTEKMRVNSEMPFSVFFNGTNGVVQAPMDITVHLDYDESLLKLDDTIIIKKGDYYGLSTAKTLEKTGNVFIKASTDEPKRDTVEHIIVSSNEPAKLDVNVFPEIIGRDEEKIDIFVSLLDENDLPTKATEDIKLNIFADDTLLDDAIEDDLKPNGAVIKKGQFGFYLREKFTFQPFQVTDLSEFDTGEEEEEEEAEGGRDLTIEQLRCEEATGEDIVCRPAGIVIGANAEGLKSDTDIFIVLDTLDFDDLNKTESRVLQLFVPEKIPSESTAIMVYQLTILENNVNDESEKERDTLRPIDDLEEGEYYPVQVDSNFSPAKLVENLNVVSSDNRIIRIDDFGNLRSSQSYGTAILSSGDKVGEASISTVLKGLVSGTVTTSVVNPIAVDDTRIFSPAPKNIIFNDQAYSDLFFILLDSSERPTTTKTGIKYLIAPINELIEIQSGESFVKKQVFSNSFGNLQQINSTNVNATAIGIDAVSDIGSESAFWLVPPLSTVKVFVPFENIAGVDSENPIGTVQLLDVYGNPVLLPYDLKVRLSSNYTSTIQVPSSVTITAGKSFAEFPITTFDQSGVSWIFATTDLLHGSDTPLVIEPYYPHLDVNIAYTDDTIEWNKEVSVDIFVEDEYFESISDARIRFSPGPNSTVTPTAIRTDADGSATVLFKTLTPQATTYLTAEASKDGYTDGEATIDLVVTGFTQGGGGTIFGLPFWVTYAGIAGVVGGIGAVVFMIFRKPKPTEEELAEEEGGEI